MRTLDEKHRQELLDDWNTEHKKLMEIVPILVAADPAKGSTLGVVLEVLVDRVEALEELLGHGKSLSPA